MGAITRSIAVRRRWVFAQALVAVATVFITSASSMAGDDWVAGVEPSQRPAGAPSIGTVQKAEGWEAQSSHGISKPLPGNVHEILTDQGNWYTPFDHPGMTGPYDIRRWHSG